MRGNDKSYYPSDDELASEIKRVTRDENGIAYSKRDVVKMMHRYCLDKKSGNKIGVLFGMRLTGKTVAMLQVAEMLIKKGKRVAYAELDYNDRYDIRHIRFIIKRYVDEGYEYLFLDEAVYAFGLLNEYNEDWPKKAVFGNNIKVIMAAGDNFLLWKVMVTVLYNKMELFDANTMTYDEYGRLTGGTYDGYLRSGGVFCNDEAEEDVEIAMAKNIVHSIHIEDNEEYDLRDVYTVEYYRYKVKEVRKIIIGVIKYAAAENMWLRADVMSMGYLKAVIEKWMAGVKKGLVEYITSVRIRHGYDIHEIKQERTIELTKKYLVKIGCLAEAYIAPVIENKQKREIYYFKQNKVMRYATDEVVKGLEKDSKYKWIERDIKVVRDGCEAENIAFVTQQ
jgi:hypothetical protein